MLVMLIITAILLVVIIGLLAGILHLQKTYTAVVSELATKCDANLTAIKNDTHNTWMYYKKFQDDFEKGK